MAHTIENQIMLYLHPINLAALQDEGYYINPIITMDIIEHI